MIGLANPGFNGAKVQPQRIRAKAGCVAGVFFESFAVNGVQPVRQLSSDRYYCQCIFPNRNMPPRKRMPKAG